MKKLRAAGLHSSIGVFYAKGCKSFKDGLSNLESVLPI